MRLWFAVLLLILSGPAAAEERQSLAGWLLVAEPKLEDPNFAHTVVFLVEHNERGAMGLVLNRVLGKGTFGAFLKGLNIELETADRDFDLHYGGPVEQRRGFVLHSPDFRGEDATKEMGDFTVTTHVDVLRAMARGGGPKHSLFAMGYAGWSAGQMEAEIDRGDWTYVRAEPGVVFETPPEEMWDLLHSKAGLSL